MSARSRGMGALGLGLASLAALLLPATSHAMAPTRKGPPGFIVGNDGMSCAGTLIELGDTPDRVIHLCGAPSSAKHWRLKWRGKGREMTGILDLWRYERYGSLPRLLRFENGVLVSLVAISSF